jgi:hypothetical protein
LIVELPNLDKLNAQKKENKIYEQQFLQTVKIDDLSLFKENEENISPCSS